MLAEWLDRLQEKEWDKQIVEDFQNGGLNELIEQAKQQSAAGECKPL